MDKKTLLIVDDSRVSRMMLKSIISYRRPDWAILEAEHAANALEVLESNEVDLFSIDLNMPGIDGLELIEQLRTRYPDSGMALLTANIQDATHQRANKLGVSCINKPITEESVDLMLESFL